MATDPTPSLSLDEKRQVLTRFSKAVKREAHNLQHWPDLLYQQLYNRLQWDEEPVPQVLKPEFERRTAPGAAPWMRTRTPFRESEALVRTLAGHTGPVTACCMSPDGRWIVSGSDDKTLKVWDVETGQEQKTLSGHTGGVNSCCMSPDGRWIVSGSYDKTLKVWDAETGQEQMTLEGHTNSVTACCMSPNGRWIVSGSWDETLKVWDAETGQEEMTLKAGYPVYACCMSPDGRRIVSGGFNFTLKVWDVETGQEKKTLSGHTDRVTSCCISPDGRWIVSGSGDNTLKVWDVETGQVNAGIVLPGGIECLGFHPWRPLLACGDAGGSVYIVDLMGIEYGPIIVTAVDSGAGPRVHCPACRTLLPLQEDWLGQVVSCPQPGREGRMRVNPFVTKMQKIQFKGKENSLPQSDADLEAEFLAMLEEAGREVDALREDADGRKDEGNKGGKEKALSEIEEEMLRMMEREVAGAKGADAPGGTQGGEDPEDELTKMMRQALEGTEREEATESEPTLRLQSQPPDQVSPSEGELKLIAGIALFKGLTTQEATLVLQISETRQYEPRRIIYEVGAPSTEMFILVGGKLAVMTEKRCRIATIQAGDSVGDMEVMTDIPYCARVVALEQSHGMSIPKKALRALLSREQDLCLKFQANLIEALSKRLRGMGRLLDANEGKETE